MSAPSTSTSKRDAINAAMSVADDVAQNKLDPSSLDAALADELRRLFGDVAEQDDSLWSLQCDVARQVIALGGISPDELAEWAAALRHRDPEPSDECDADDDSTEPVSTGSDALSPQNDALDAIAERQQHTDAASSADVDTETQPDERQQHAEPASSTDDGCGCSSGPTMVTLPDGRRLPSHLIAARGRDLPTVH
ncbi:flagellar hook-length control protein [Mycolicibacterium novocastrense]|uniref:Flagellar hook-length control protein n=1 Tax=Mycolicibacterium novocastrense TaxID=59813 RepID=A0AAW5SDB3_MYCNV|nr:hypothetical protein [Mycolicibacterium novocastrense]MCV7022088.1 flagellar hook-length control protein [Mycolicibacterium novocastrense]GAT09367.1 flagellar hook-length control protein [Mycolicibacterium novocastrense]